MEFLSDLLKAVSLTATFLIVWFLTNAYFEYASKIIPNIFKEYLSFIKDKGFVYYADYLESKHTFFNKMLSCPFCIGFWIALLSSIIYNIVFYICVIYIVSLILFFGIKQICCKN